MKQELDLRLHQVPDDQDIERDTKEAKATEKEAEVQMHQQETGKREEKGDDGQHDTQDASPFAEVQTP